MSQYYKKDFLCKMFKDKESFFFMMNDRLLDVTYDYFVKHKEAGLANYMTAISDEDLTMAQYVEKIKNII